MECTKCSDAQRVLLLRLRVAGSCLQLDAAGRWRYCLHASVGDVVPDQDVQQMLELLLIGARVQDEVGRRYQISEHGAESLDRYLNTTMKWMGKPCESSGADRV